MLAHFLTTHRVQNMFFIKWVNKFNKLEGINFDFNDNIKKQSNI